jgi:hypothetical protein
VVVSGVVCVTVTRPFDPVAENGGVVVGETEDTGKLFVESSAHWYQ